MQIHKYATKYEIPKILAIFLADFPMLQVISLFYTTYNLLNFLKLILTCFVKILKRWGSSWSSWYKLLFLQKSFQFHPLLFPWTFKMKKIKKEKEMKNLNHFLKWMLFYQNMYKQYYLLTLICNLFCIKWLLNSKHANFFYHQLRGPGLQGIKVIKCIELM